MSQRSFAKSSLLAIALGLAALGSTLAPAAVKPSVYLGNFRAIISNLPAGRAPGASLHPGGEAIHLPSVAQTIVTAANVTATNVAPVAALPCQCLTKPSLQDGSALFTDVCTGGRSGRTEGVGVGCGPDSSMNEIMQLK